MPTSESIAASRHQPAARFAFGATWLVWIVWFGCVAIVVTDVLGWFVVAGYSPIADTISDLGAGRYAVVQDLGLTGFAAALAALATALWWWNPRDGRSIASAIALGLLVPVVLLIAWHNEYGDFDRGGFTMHLELTLMLWLGFTAITWLLAERLESARRGAGTLSRVLGSTWFIGSVLYWFTPDDWDGVVERVIATLLVAWVVMVTIVLLRDARHSR